LKNPGEPERTPLLLRQNWFGKKGAFIVHRAMCNASASNEILAHLEKQLPDTQEESEAG
jgi:hypothetical protein